jgi:uncharacterized protein (TIGR03435 family)
MFLTRAAVAFMICASWANGQAGNAKPEFDVVSIKRSPPPDGGMIRLMPPSGGPGTKDPTRYVVTGLPLILLVMQAYDIQPYQLNAPDWLKMERYDVTAKIPEGATKEQFRLMMQAMLEDRFKMVAHREKKDSPVYELVVGKNGHKMKPSVEEPPKESADAVPLPLPGRGPMQMGSDGFPVLPRGGGGRGPMMIMMNGRAKMQGVHVSMDQLASSLTNQVARPVSNATGLQGNFDFTLYFSPMNGPMGPMGMAPPPPPPPPPGAGGGLVGEAPSREGEVGPNLFTAVQEQLGLKLEQKKGQIDLVVIDKMEKTPTEN